MNRRSFFKFLRDGTGAAILAATVGLREIVTDEPKIEDQLQGFPEELDPPLHTGCTGYVSLDDYAEGLGISLDTIPANSPIKYEFIISEGDQNGLECCQECLRRDARLRFWGETSIRTENLHPNQTI